eukprot:s1421_g3.t1
MAFGPASLLCFARRKRSITAVVRPNQRLVDFYQVENRGLAFASTQTGSREPRSNTRISFEKVLPGHFQFHCQDHPQSDGRSPSLQAYRLEHFELKIAETAAAAEDHSPASESALNRTWILALYNEVEILLRTDHPNIVKLFEVFEDEVNMYVILQWCEGGNILERIQKEPDLSESAAHILQQVLHAACHLHLNLICHRNLTLEHICLFERNLPLEKSVVKLWGFELATTLPKEGASMSESIVEHGNVSYMAPELLMQMPLYYKNFHCGRDGRLHFEYSRMRSSTLEYARVRSSTLEYARVRSSTHEYARVRSSTLEYARVRSSALECARVLSSALECARVRSSTLEYARVRALGGADALRRHIG